jgi:hypothetical protein
VGKVCGRQPAVVSTPVGAAPLLHETADHLPPFESDDSVRLRASRVGSVLSSAAVPAMAGGARAAPPKRAITTAAIQDLRPNRRPTKPFISPLLMHAKPVDPGIRKRY